MVRHIPTITLKSESQPIWYDSECHRKCKEKERYHKMHKRSGSLHDVSQPENERYSRVSYLYVRSRENA